MSTRTVSARTVSARTVVARIAAVGASAALTFAACGGGDDEPSAAAPAAATDAASAPAGSSTAAAAITIASFAFSGPSEVAAGTVLTITNADSAPHTFTADDGSFDTGTIQPGDSAQVTLTSAGTFAYHCEIHSSMAGSIDVTA